jgi:hypothetical protein
MSEINKEQVQSLFDYKDGKLFWKSDRARGKVKAGSEAGSLSYRGYKRLMIGYKEYPAHKIVFLLHHGYMPKVIDHIDGNPLNNKIENLREATAQTNQYNRKRGSNNTSGCKNVSWNEKGKTWQVHVRQNKKVHCWYAKDFELAELIAQEARTKFHGEFVNHG